MHSRSAEMGRKICRRLAQKRLIPAWSVFLSLLVLTGFVYYIITSQIENAAKAQFGLLTSEIVSQIDWRMRRHEQILLGGAGLFDVNGTVSRAEWHRYVSRLNLSANTPGIQGVGFAKVIMPSELDQHVADVRAEGFPDYAVRPTGDRPVYTSIIYLEPFEGRNLAAFGYDMFSERVRQEAMRSAVENHATSITGKVTLVQETHEKMQAGFLMYVPVYRGGVVRDLAEARWQDLTGFVYSPFRVGDLMQGILGHTSADTLRFQIFDGDSIGADQLLYDSNETHQYDLEHSTILEATHKYEGYGRIWTINFRGRPEFQKGTSLFIRYAIVSLGILIAGMAFGLIFSLVTRRESAEMLAKTMTGQLAANANALRELHAIMSDPSLDFDERIERTLMFGIRLFGLPLGVVSQIESGACTVDYVMGPDWAPSKGSRYSVEATPCSHVFAEYQALAIDPIAFNNSGMKLPWQSPPGGQSYIGAPLRVDNRIAGTVSFSGPRFHDGKFTESDSSMILVIGEWISAIINRRHQIEALSDREGRLSSLFETVKDGIITIDETGAIETANSAAREIFGYSADELIGRNIKMLMPEPYASNHDRYLHSYLAFGVRKIIGTGREVVGRRKDSVEFPMDLGVNEIKAKGVRRFVGVVRDVTERKKVERAHKEFISTVSHELRTPLTSILGSLSLVRSGAISALPEMSKNLIEMAHTNCERLIRLINDILDIEKFESGNMAFRKDFLDFVGLVKDAVAANRGFATQMHVRLREELGSAAAMILGDRDRLMQVLANLISNASKFSPQDATVDIRVENNGAMVRLAVADSGIGIPKEFCDKVFRKFSQADSSDSRQKSGTGLGLSITKSIVEGHSGRIWFESGEGQGTTFFVELPIVGSWDQPAPH